MQIIFDPFMIHEAFPTLTETASGSHPCCVVSVTYARARPTLEVADILRVPAAQGSLPALNRVRYETSMGAHRAENFRGGKRKNFTSFCERRHRVFASIRGL